MDLRSTAFQDGRTYGNVTVSRGAQAQLGDNFIYNHFNGPPPDDVYDTLLQALTFNQMDARLRNVAAALPSTCEWIKSRDESRIWSEHHSVEENHGILWIKGKPGSGKSTVMKEVLSWAECTWTREIILSYFFNARATEDLEKTCLGLYRSLLHQTLRKNHSIQPLFVQEFASKVRKNNVDIWTEVELQNFLIRLVSRKQLTCLNIFIDALDEGDEDNVRLMVEFFEQLSLHATSAGVNFRLCLSSRHYPHISLEGALSITLEYQPEHNKAIQVYVDRKLRGEESQMKETVKLILLRKAAGVFLWVVLVVPMLNKIHDQGRGMKSVQDKLDSIPQTLHELFVSLLSRASDTEEECGVILRLVLHSLRPLDPLELYSLVQHKCGAKVDDYVELPPHQSMADYLNDQGKSVLRWITDCSRGLVEVVNCTRAQFIHETVRSSLMSTSLDPSNQPSKPPSKRLSFDFERSVSHCFIAELCIEYYLDVCDHDKLSLATNGNVLLNPRVTFGPASYAANYWWQHIKNARMTPHLLKLATNLICDRIALGMWARGDEYDGHDVYGTPFPQYPRETEHATAYSIRMFGGPVIWIVPSLDEPVYLAALLGIPDLVEWILSNGQSADAYGDYYGSALQAASVRGDTLIVEKLIAAGAEINRDGGRYGNALKAAASRGHVNVARMLLANGAKLDAPNLRILLTEAVISRENEAFTLFMSACHKMPPCPATIDVVLCTVCQMSGLLGCDNSARLFNQAMQHIFRGIDIEVIVVAFRPQTSRDRIWPDTQSNDIARLVAEHSKACQIFRETPQRYLVIPELFQHHTFLSEHPTEREKYTEHYNRWERRTESLYGPMLPWTVREEADTELLTQVGAHLKWAPGFDSRGQQRLMDNFQRNILDLDSST